MSLGTTTKNALVEINIGERRDGLDG